MEINKKVDIKKLKEQIEENKKIAIINDDCLVHIHIMLVQEVIDVLEETYKREQRYKTEESGQKPKCFGAHSEDDICCPACIYENECVERLEDEKEDEN